jgi:trans-aconitate methyltransferase
LIAGLCDHIGQPVKRILDAGCGVGLLRAPLKRAWPRSEYVGLEVSQYRASAMAGGMAASRT